MSQRQEYRNGYDEDDRRPGSHKAWVNPLDPGPSKLPSRPVDPNSTHSKRSSSPSRSERSNRRNSPGREENGRRLEGYSESTRRSRSPERGQGDRYSSKRPRVDTDPSSRPQELSRPRGMSGSSYRKDQDHYSGGRDGREERYEGGHQDWSGSSHRARHEPRRDEWNPSSRHDERHNLSHRSQGDLYRPDTTNMERDGYDRGPNSDRRERNKDPDRSQDDRLDHRFHSSRLDHEEFSRSQRRYSQSRNQSPIRHRPKPEPEAEAEEGEIEEEESPPQPDRRRATFPEPRDHPSSGMKTALSAQPSQTGSVSGSPSGYLPIKIKNRPTKRKSDTNVLAETSMTSSAGPRSGGSTVISRHSDTYLPPPPPPLGPAPADDRPATPPAPGSEAPPPPPEQPPTPPPEQSRVTPKSTHTSKSKGPSPYSSATPAPQPPRGPSNRALDITKSQAKYDEHGDRTDGKTSVPHAPNRNLLNPNTRPTTPAAKFDTPGGRDTPKTKLFSRPTAEDEQRNLHKSFFGTTTLAAYDLGDKLGEGTFGVVTKGVEIATKRPIALKKLITHNPRDGVSVTTVREIKILKSLNHPSVVEIIDMVVERKNHADRTHRGDVFMVFPYMDHDMCGLLSNSDFKLSHSVAKLLMRQILEGMDYIHTSNFVHRDIKTANILVDREGGIKIADFGLARSWTFDEAMPKHLATEYTNMVVTRWYRAPELLLGDRHYGPAVDMWSIGCVLGEMYHRIPILQGETDRDQLFKIFGKVGRPSDESFPGWKKLPGFPDSIGYPWDQVTEDQPLLQTARKWGMDRGGADLMMQLLRLDPVRRLTAFDALDHDWFWTSPKPANKSKNLITVESSHEMTQRIKNDPPPMARPKARPPPQQRPPQAWNNAPPPQQRHPMNGNSNQGGPPNPYSGAPGMNPYGQQRPRPPSFDNGLPVAAYGNGHGPPGIGMGMGNGMGMGAGMNGSYGGPYQGPGGGGGGGMGRPPPGQFHGGGGGGQGMGGLPPRPPPYSGPGQGQGYNSRPNFNSSGQGQGGPGSGAGAGRRNAPPPPFILGGTGGGGNLPSRPKTVMDVGRRGGGSLPWGAGEQ